MGKRDKIGSTLFYAYLASITIVERIRFTFKSSKTMSDLHENFEFMVKLAITESRYFEI